jgi:hypothetical protein
MRELRLPNDAIKDPQASEILRVWISGENQGFVSRPDVWDDPAAWGLLLVDVARQIARGYCQKHGGDPKSVLSRIKEGLDAEWLAPTDGTSGEVVS